MVYGETGLTIVGTQRLKSDSNHGAELVMLRAPVGESSSEELRMGERESSNRLESG
jgi:hypothetical protein